jgi:hypothetical protein
MLIPTRFLRCGIVSVSLFATACGSGSSPTPSTARPTSTVAPSATATPTATLLAIGDPCVVGRWTGTTRSYVDTSTVPGATITISGAAGFVFTLTAAGNETDDPSNAAPYSGSGGGHTLSFVLRGTEQFTFHAMAGQWVDSGGSGQFTFTNYVLDGVHEPNSTAPPDPAPGSGTYSCSGSTLTLVETTPYPSTSNYTK